MHHFGKNKFTYVFYAEMKDILLYFKGCIFSHFYFRFMEIDYCIHTKTTQGSFQEQRTLWQVRPYLQI